MANPECLEEEEYCASGDETSGGGVSRNSVARVRTFNSIAIEIIIQLAARNV
jgi:hypothetical protein